MKRVILVRPEGPRNVGMILRATRNFGPCELALVAPQKPSMLVHPEFEQMAHGAQDARDAILVFGDLESALADTTRSVGFSARVRGKRVRAEWRGLQDQLTRVGDANDELLALVFGNEISGLTIAETDLLEEIVHIRTAKEHTSLNLAVCAAIVLSSLFSGRTVHQKEPGGKMLNGAGRAFLKTRLKEVFAGKVALTPAAANDISESIDRVFSRVPLENRDARAWHLMLRALGSDMTPVELGLRPNERDGRRKDAIERRSRHADPGVAGETSSEEEE